MFGFTAAALVGHRLALLLGVPVEWFAGDAVGPHAIWVAGVTDVSFLVIAFFLTARGPLHFSGRSFGAAAIVANPLSIGVGFALYRLLPVTVEAAYVSPASFVIAVASSPLLWFAALRGLRTVALA
jgi:hypothetical protein